MEERRDHTCEIEVIAGFFLKDLKVKRLAFNTGTQFNVEIIICRKKETKTTQ